ncbi:PP2C family serine/threonine-protein phosphatase [Roseofilum sp. SID3]|nr:PP2C family serine/threonine-protein phosphatase [Roseofilum sp. SID3]
MTELGVNIHALNKPMTMSTLSGDLQTPIPHDPDHILSPLNGWQAIASSVLGTSHQKRGQPCQDAHAWDILGPGLVVAAVADGAGSASLSDVGAQVATRTAVELIKRQWDRLAAEQSEVCWEALLGEVLEHAQNAIAAESLTRDVEVRQLATTLLILVASSQEVAVAQIGDGAVVIGDRQGHITALTQPENGEYANETTFLISPNALESAQIKVWEGEIAHFALFSDGLQRLALKLPEGTPHAPFFTPLFRFVDQMEDSQAAESELQGFLSHPRITERTDDDLTIVLGSLKSINN